MSSTLERLDLSLLAQTKFHDVRLADGRSLRIEGRPEAWLVLVRGVVKARVGTALDAAFAARHLLAAENIVLSWD